MTTRVEPRILTRMKSVAHIEVTASASSEAFSRTVTTAELDVVDQCQLSDLEEVPDSRINGANIPNVQQAPPAPTRPQLKLMNPDRPVRYIPIHVW